MPLVYILIKDLKNKSQYIYNSTPIDVTTANSEMEYCFKDIQKKHSDVMLLLNTNTNCKKIYYENIIKTPGWLWSTTEKFKEDLYELQVVELFTLEYSDSDLSDQSQMTESFESKKSFFVFGTGYANSLLSPFGKNSNSKFYKN